MRQKSRLAAGVLLVCALAGGSQLAGAQEQQTYRIGRGDILTISFWQQPDLNTTAQVRQDGIIAVPVIGEIEVAGLTPEEAADLIVQRISRYNREISQALVQVVGFNARKVFVTGQVGQPGRYTFERIPDLWTVLRQAGGPSEDADLSKVTVVDPRGVAQVVDLKKILAEGKAETLAPLEDGTTINVPRRAVYLPTDIFAVQDQDLKPVVYVTGQVLQPGPKAIEGKMSIFDAIALAGGTGPQADLSKVKITSKAGGGPLSQTLDLSGKSSDRSAMNYQVHYEDLITVGGKGGNFWSTFRDVATLVTTVSTIVLLADRLKTP
jgi:polysaccharide export outer membrane protein